MKLYIRKWIRLECLFSVTSVAQLHCDHHSDCCVNLVCLDLHQEGCPFEPVTTLVPPSLHGDHLHASFHRYSRLSGSSCVQKMYKVYCTAVTHQSSVLRCNSCCERLIGLAPCKNDLLLCRSTQSRFAGAARLLQPMPASVLSVQLKPR